MTSITLFKSVPFDENYNDTILVKNKQERNKIINTYEHKQINNVQYIRREQRIKVNMPLADAILYNYAYYISDGVETFAFVTNWEYISPEVSTAILKIDALQTYYYDINIISGFIEREHSETDGIGDNIIAENLETGEYIINHDYGNVFDGRYQIVVLSTVSADGQNIAGTMIDNKIYSGAIPLTYDEEAVEEVAQLLINLADKGKADGVLQIYMRPKETYIATMFSIKDNIDGYVPKNKKLFTYPYNMLYATNMQGMATTYKWEFFKNKNNAEFEMKAESTATCKARLTPLNYKGSKINFDEQIIATIGTQCQYTTDTFKNWLAQSRIDLLLGGVSAIENTVTGIGTAVLGANTNTGVSGSGGQYAIFDYARQTMSQMYKQAIQPPQAKGQQQETLGIIDNTQGFTVMNKTITSQYAQIIDQYFTRFGYATNSTKTPNLHSRKNHNYIRAKQVIIKGQLPKAYQKEIQRALERGITIWHDKDNFGNYEADNSIV